MTACGSKECAVGAADMSELKLRPPERRVRMRIVECSFSERIPSPLAIICFAAKRVSISRRLRGKVRPDSR
jgi:hypothetical protein